MAHARLDSICVPASPTTSSRLSNTLADLRSAIEAKFKAIPPSALPKQSREIASVVFSDFKSSTNIGSLYSLIEKSREQPLSWPNGHADNPTEFRRRVTAGKRASILAIFLLAGEDFLLETWNTLLRHLGMWPDKESGNDPLQDENLPLSIEQLNKIFDDPEHARVFDEGQHRFCQLDPRKLEPDFVEVRDFLNNEIYETRIKCRLKNRDGDMETPGVKDIWSPEARLTEVFNDHKCKLKTLFIASEYVERQDRKERLPEDAQALRELYDQKQAEADNFLRSLQSRGKILAVLIMIGINPRSWTWRHFRECCEKDDSESQRSETPTLPLPFTDLDFIEEESGRREDFHRWQFFFCPVELEQNKMCRFQGFEEVRLPLLSKEWIGSGASGGVYKVVVEKGYFDQTKTRELAMKVLDRKARYSYMEWHSANKLKDQLFESRGIIMPLASVLTKNEIYLFMELAEGDLHKFMAETPGPKNFPERHKRLAHMQDLALSLKHLHVDLWANDEGFEGRREALIHGDVKAGNVLYTLEQSSGEPSKVRLKISDFGVSAFHYSPKDISGESARDRYSKARLAPGCPNFPPEAEDNGDVNAKIDIWGFATVFVDFVAWISGGTDALRSLRTARGKGSRSEEQHLYYTTDGSGVKIMKPGIGAWFNQLICKTYQDDEQDMYRACWNLIKDVLLVCEPEKRGKIEDVIDGLSKILKNNHYTREDSALRPTTSSDFTPRALDSTTSNDSSSRATHREGKMRVGLLTESQKERNKRFQSAVKEHKTADAIEFARPGDNVHMDDDHGETAFHYAVFREDDQLLVHLLENHSELLKQPDDHGRIALHSCVRLNTEWAVKSARLILKKDASVSRMRNANGDTALDLARKRSSVRQDIIKLLERYDQK